MALDGLLRGDAAAPLPRTVPFHRFSVADALRTLVQGTPEEEQFIVVGRCVRNSAGQRVFTTLETGLAWERHEALIKRLSCGTAVLGAVILYADETCLNTIHGRYMPPIKVPIRVPIKAPFNSSLFLLNV